MNISTAQLDACDIEGHPSELEDDVLIISFYHFPATEDEKECFDVVDVVVHEASTFEGYDEGDDVLELFDESDVIQSLKEHRKGEQE